MITKEEFFEKYNLSEELLQSTEMSWEELCNIYEDFYQNKYNKYRDIMNEFLDTYFRDLDLDEKSDIKVHSIHHRVKDPEHLIAKIIRRKQANAKKYKDLTVENYEKFITDLIGIRCLVLFKVDWKNLHYYLISKFENKEENYIHDSILDYDNDDKHYYIAEKPKAHIRIGDARDIYDKILSPDSVIAKDGKIYRSVHYTIKYEGVYLEIQVRTLFEEGWGEIDHSIVYPYYQNDKILKEYTELLNRLSGLADEMGSFFVKLKRIEVETVDSVPDVDDSNSIEKKDTEVEENSMVTKHDGERKMLRTPNDCLKAVIDEREGGNND